MFKLPSDFDMNEYFVLITMISLLILVIKVPKLMPRLMSLSIFLYFSVLGLTADVLIGVDYPFDFYQIMDSPKLEIFDVFIYGVNYPIYGYFFSYIIYKWNTRRVIVILIICWSGITTFIEWVSVKFHVFTYQNGWNIGFSAMAYLVVYTFSAFVILYFIHCWKTSDKKNQIKHPTTQQT
ncbi:hypothetical protein [Bacillus sp. PS06]|uniref:hypothetical protein n=1 Tax=Bacillus sp. PS06 TaxID=2764176 RepID=UPI00178017D3|nr:hypothetical protein [Bacillus sp. PS06]MBD8071424.1 hypothetical protein [Bacillus sp. PS06]